ncbi:MAG TPA: TIGR03087 family PEP-CTERM/XrtA system glycosyltransferase [Burkholderiales bacterium]|nr:TIGR03087 family PEP-CTERM/XrtA system glycosyltransferase [Burkholderiales bacterium]
MQDLLYLAQRLPYPPGKGDRARAYHLLQHLLKRYRVHLGAFIEERGDRQYSDVLRRMCAGTCLRPLRPALARARSLPALLSARALGVSYYRDSALRRWVDATVQRHAIKHIVVGGAAMAQFVMHLNEAQRVADFGAVRSIDRDGSAAGKPAPVAALYRHEAARMLEFEVRVARAFDATVCGSGVAADRLRRRVPERGDRICHVGSGVDTEAFSPEREYARPYPAAEKVLLYTGALDVEGAGAAEWFAREVLPQLRAADAALRLYVVGARARGRDAALGDIEGVVLAGAVADLRPYLAHAALIVAPGQVEEGPRGQVLEAMAMAKAVVTSAETVAALDAANGRELWAATDAADWVARIRAGLADGGASHALGRAARVRALADFRWSGNLRRFDRLLSGLRLLPRPVAAADAANGGQSSDRSGTAP